MQAPRPERPRSSRFSLPRRRRSRRQCRPATPAAPAETDVVTLVLWYQNATNQDIIELYPLATDAGFVARPQQGAAAVGTVDFPDEGIPTVVVGNTTFETYPRPDGVIERWTWLDDFEGARPATLVMQLSGVDGTYQNYFGTGTFVSRDEGGAGGVLTLALRPPSPAAANEAGAAEPAAADAAADAPAADEAAAAGGGTRRDRRTRNRDPGRTSDRGRGAGDRRRSTGRTGSVGRRINPA